jgi:hypothetical protein
MKKQNGFIWWGLDLLALLLVAAMLLVHRLHLSSGWEEALQIIVIVAVYSLIALWWRANRATLVQRDSTTARPTTGETQDRPGLTEVQARYRESMSIEIEKEKQ